MGMTFGSTSEGASNPIADALVSIDKAIGVVRDHLPFVTDHQLLGDVVLDVIGLGTDLDSLRLQLIKQAEVNGVAQRAGLRTMGQFVAAHTNNPAAPSNRDRRLIKWLRHYPVFEAALERRDMTVAHLEYMRTKIDTARTYQHLRDDQQILADAARDCGFDGFKTVCDYWMIAVDPDGEEPKDQIAKTFLQMRKGPGGRMLGKFSLDAATGAMLETMVEHEAEKICKDDIATGALRSPGERNALALVRLAERGFRREDGTHPVPLLNMVMSQKVAEWAIEQLTNPDPNCDRVPVDAFDIDGRCELIDGTPVHPFLIAAVTRMYTFGAPNLRRCVMDAKSRILDYSYNARSAPQPLRTANHLENRGRCTIPGCDAPHHWLQIDHVDPDSNGGETSLPNTQPACRPDNQAKGATTGHTAWKNKPPIKRRKPHHRTRRPNPDPDPDPDDDPDGDSSDG